MSTDFVPTESQSSSAFKPQMNEELAATLQGFQEKLGIWFHDPWVLLTALTHQSYPKIDCMHPVSGNGRIEFLGDGIFGGIVSEFIYDFYQVEDGAFLHEMMHFLRSNSLLHEVGLSVDLPDYLYYDPGLHNIEHFKLEDVISDTMEAVIAAIYKDRGGEIASRFLEPHLKKRAGMFLELRAKQQVIAALLYEAYRQGEPIPHFELIDYQRTHRLVCYIIGIYQGAKLLGQGTGMSVKTANRRAAINVLNHHYGVAHPLPTN